MDKIGVFDFGGQYCHLIARRIRDLGVYAEIIYEPSQEYKGFILSGGPGNISEEEAPQLPEEFFNEVEVPVLGICYGHQMIAQTFGGKVERGREREYGKKTAILENSSSLFKGLNKEEQVWMSHYDQVTILPDDFDVIGSTDICGIAAYQNIHKNIFGVQFHPEVIHTINGTKILKNFLDIIGCKREWKLSQWVEKKIHELQTEIGSNRVIMAVSGGVDSTVAAALLTKAKINAHFIHVDTGLMRLNESEEVAKIFEDLGTENLHIVDAKKRFFKRLEDISDPELKRKIIGNLFIDIFEEESDRLDNFDFLGQGTIYPDRIESAQPSKHASVIKTHHNVGGLPERMKLKLIEPLNELYKDEVRKIGEMLGLPKRYIDRHPFPGPALAIRILGIVTEERVDILRKADAIVTQIIENNGIYDSLWQVFPALIPVKSVGVMGDKRTYEYILTIRAVESVDAMTADWARLDYDVLEEISTKIINKVNGVNRVLYDITSKPPGTIEYE
ncbi:MAG: glutamine-hydrolyzing GMP synthase [Candidatus Heimdallarchaeota archaeon]|nr:glutamine-hydrolyzing GMP synthase [Candidatus Heimdallarchaeota archaeon]